jgi:ankyrin repeat protein
MSTAQPDDQALLAFCHVIAGRDLARVGRLLDASPELARASIRTGASRQDPDTFFISAIRHYVYRGDTALHIAAAAHQRAVAERLIARGAPIRARNRRGAEPLHYAADGSPGATFWDPDAQRSTVEYLIGEGADPNVFDDSGVAALHRAVRTRSAAAVLALLDGGADVRLQNKRGSTPLHLAVQNTGRSDSGSAAAKDQQMRIISLLLAHGARPTDKDAKGKTVVAAATSEDIRALL